MRNAFVIYVIRLQSPDHTTSIYVLDIYERQNEKGCRLEFWGLPMATGLNNKTPVITGTYEGIFLSTITDHSTIIHGG